MRRLELSAPTERAATLTTHRGCVKIYTGVALVFPHSTSKALTFCIGCRHLFIESSSIDGKVEFTSLKCTVEVSHYDCMLVMMMSVT